MGAIRMQERVHSTSCSLGPGHKQDIVRLGVVYARDLPRARRIARGSPMPPFLQALLGPTQEDVGQQPGLGVTREVPINPKQNKKAVVFVTEANDD